MGMRKPPYRGILHNTVHGLCPKEQKMALITCADCGNLISSEALQRWIATAKLPEAAFCR